MAVQMAVFFVSCNKGGQGMHAIDPDEGLKPDNEGVIQDRIPEDALDTIDPNGTFIPTVIPGTTSDPDVTATPTTPDKPVTPDDPDTPAYDEYPALDYKSFTPADKVIAFTFNDGPTGFTKTIVDYLADKEGKVTFFVVGERISNANSEWSQTTAKGIASGHEYGFLSLSDDSTSSYYNEISLDELHDGINQTNAYLKALGGKDVTLLRPVGGGTHMDKAAKYGYPSVLWSIDPQDWSFHSKYKKGELTKEQAIEGLYRTIVEQARSGGIVLMQDLYEISAEAFIRAYETLTNDGYKFVTVSEMLSLEGKNANGYTFHSTSWAVYGGERVK